MRILWLTWKDHAHPAAGGAELVLTELSTRLVAEGHDVTFLTCGYKGAAQSEDHNGIHIFRIGTNRYVHPFQALAYYVRGMRNSFDIVIEVVNTAPYFGVFFGKNAKRFLFYHQLAREIWFHETKPPMSQLGYHVMEPIATRMLAQAKVPTITVSKSTQTDLARFGFKPDSIHIISEGIHIKPVSSLGTVQKYDRPTLLSLGALRAMKRTKDHIKAFELAKPHIPKLQLKIAGLADGRYGDEVLELARQSPFAKDIEYLGRVSDQKKVDLMRRSHVLLQTALKEGWGLTVSEAASQGTPAIVYDADGLRDSVRHHETGLITHPHPETLSKRIVELLSDHELYTRLREAAWAWSRELTFDQSYKDFKKVLELT